MAGSVASVGIIKNVPLAVWNQYHVPKATKTLLLFLVVVHRPFFGPLFSMDVIPCFKTSNGPEYGHGFRKKTERALRNAK